MDVKKEKCCKNSSPRYNPLNWRHECTSCGSATDSKGYVVAKKTPRFTGD